MSPPHIIISISVYLIAFKLRQSLNQGLIFNIKCFIIRSSPFAALMMEVSLTCSIARNSSSSWPSENVEASVSKIPKNDCNMIIDDLQCYGDHSSVSPSPKVIIKEASLL